MCAQWTLFDLGFDSPNIAKGLQWIHVSVCLNARVNACVAACKVIHWLRQTKYDILSATHTNKHRCTSHYTPSNALTHQPRNMKACVCMLCAVGRTPEAVCWAHWARLLEMWLTSSERGEGRSSRRAAGSWSNRSIIQKRASTLLIQEVVFF